MVAFACVHRAVLISALLSGLSRSFSTPPQRNGRAFESPKTALSSFSRQNSKSNEAEVSKKLVIDPRTGLYRPTKSVPIDKGNGGNNRDGFNPLSWDGFKSFVYDRVDALASSKDAEKAKRNMESDDFPSSRLSSTSTKMSPGSLTLSELAQSSSSPTMNQFASPIVGSYQQREEEFLKSLKSASSTRRLADEFKPKVQNNIDAATKGNLRTQDSGGAFDTFKSAVYKGADAISSTSNEIQKMSLSQSPSASSYSNKRPPGALQPQEIQARMLGSDADFVQAMQELQSDNPLARLAAGYNVKRILENGQVFRQKQSKRASRDEQIQAIKSTIYQTSDAIVSGAENLLKLPQKATETYKGTVAKTRQAVYSAKTLPDQLKQRVQAVKERVDEVEQSVQGSVDTTKQLVEKTKQLPTELQTKVKETTESVQVTARKTKEAWQGVGKTAKDVSTSSKVLLGLEKPVPKPPQTLPSKKQQDGELSKLGWKALSATGSLAGKVTWIVGKESAKLAWKGTELLYQKGKQALDEANAEEKQRNTLAKAAFQGTQLDEYASATRTESSALEEKTTLEAPEATKASRLAANKEKAQKSSDTENLTQRKEVMEVSVSDLEKEIADALRLAEEAIASAKAELGSDVDDEEEDDLS